MCVWCMCVNVSLVYYRARVEAEEQHLEVDLPPSISTVELRSLGSEIWAISPGPIFHCWRNAFVQYCSLHVDSRAQEHFSRFYHFNQALLFCC